VNETRRIQIDPATDPTKPGLSPWLDLEDGVQLQPGERFRSGDFWLIPDRIETGDVEWPTRGRDNPLALPPVGIEDHFAPLAIVGLNAANQPTVFDLRRLFPALAQ